MPGKTLTMWWQKPDSGAAKPQVWQSHHTAEMQFWLKGVDPSRGKLPSVRPVDALAGR
jgi:hypothetical protein